MADDTAVQVARIAAACEQQAAVDGEISRRVADVKSIADRIAENMGGSSQDIADLAAQTESLGELVTEMRQG